MTLAGTIVNGHVQLDHPSDLPDGTRVTLLPDEEEYEYPHPMAPYDREKEIVLLRESIALMDARDIGRSVADVFADIEKSFDYPPSERR